MLFDKDVLIRALKGDANAQREIDGDAHRFLSAVNYMELLQGARDKKELAMIKQFLTALDFEILPITEAVSHRATIFVEEYALKNGIRAADALVYATACENALRLCSANQEHFRGIAALQTRTFRPAIP